jgi:predicted phosphodiesterase
MFNALILSDLHLEHGEPFVVHKIEGVEFLILAGDIGSYKSHYSFIKDCCTKYKVIYILGNHEFYGYSMKEVREFWKNVELENFYFLDNSSVVIDGIRFIGSTLWTDFDNENYLRMMNAKNSISDFAKIVKNDNSGHITPINILEEFKESRQFIESELEKHDDVQVLITHHAPSYMSVDEKFQGHPNNAYFASNLDNMIAYSNLSLVVHGHMHTHVDYMLDTKRVVANPRGYPGDTTSRFDPEFVIKLK